MAIDLANPNPITQGKTVIDVINDLIHGRNPFRTGDKNRKVALTIISCLFIY
jgi:hypothetical protein